MKNHIIVLKEKLSIIEDYAARIQSTLVEIINISSFIVKYLRKNDRMTDVDMIEVMKDK